MTYFKNALKLSLLVSLSISLGFDFHSDKASCKEDVIYENLRILAQALSVVEKKSLRNIDMKEFLLEAVKSAIAKKTDAHSCLIEDSSQMMESTSGAFAGIGVSVSHKNQDDDAMLVIDVLEDSPSQKAGMMPGDKIISIGEEKLRGLNTEEVVQKMKGKRGTKVKIKVLRSKRLIELEIMRDTIVEPSSIGYFLPETKAFYFHLRIFSEKSIGQLKKLLIENAQNPEKCNGVILDLRENPGGILEAAIAITNMFIPRGMLVASTVDSTGKKVTEYKTTSDPIFNCEIPLFIIINNFTASAAEILAGALRHYSQEQDKFAKDKKRTVPMVFLVGSETHGKGSVQEVVPIGGGHAIKLTTMLYLLPDGQSIQEIGVKPDLEVSPKFPAPKEVRMIMNFYGREKSLKNHITHSEASSILLGQELELSSKIDKLEEKKRLSIEEKQYKKDDDETQDIDDDEVQAEEENRPKKNPELVRQEALGKNYLIGICAKMIGMLGFLEQNGIKFNSREKVINFFNKNFISEQPVKIEKIKQ